MNDGASDPRAGDGSRDTGSAGVEPASPRASPKTGAGVDSPGPEAGAGARGRDSGGAGGASGPRPGSEPPLYRGEPLDASRGPGLGCFWMQVAVLAILVVLTPIGVVAAWPIWLTGGMLIATIVLLLLAGQTVVFLLRLVAADRRTRRRPLRGTTPTVGDLEESGRGRAAGSTGTSAGAARTSAPSGELPAGSSPAGASPAAVPATGAPGRPERAEPPDPPRRGSSGVRQ